MQLIRDCYARAGLDLTDPAGRPQYFECHGTGTLAGDSAEAEAICTSFFPNAEEAKNDSDRLVVGSIKSVVGHTEGTAGLAGILRASLALQNATIPPNLLFNSLNPSIKPFYGNLQVATTAIPWPSVPHDGPRRASVNR
jgi:acyl transferase domain-containing protein